MQGGAAGRSVAASNDPATGSPPWARREKESPVANGAFRIYRDLGPQRTFIGAARQLGKAQSLIRRWAQQHEWRHCAWQWDEQQQQADAQALRQERDEQLRQSLRHAAHLTRLSMGRLAALLHRDPETGELALDDSATPHVAVQIYRLALDIRRDIYHSLAAPAGADPEESVASEMGRMSDSELESLIQLAKERAQVKKEEE